MLSSVDKLQKKLGESTARTILPEEYGGTVPLQQMTSQWAAHLEQKRLQYFLVICFLYQWIELVKSYFFQRINYPNYINPG